MTLPTSYFNLLEAFPQRGCAICTILLQATRHRLDSLLYEYVTDPAIHHKLRASRGLCNEHGRQLAALQQGLGTAILMEAALDEVLQLIDQSLSSTGQWRKLPRALSLQPPQAALAQALDPTQPCFICQHQHEQADYLAATLGASITDERLQAAYRASDGLCLPHFKLTLQQTPRADHAQRLADIQRQIWQALRDDLRELMRKSNVQGQREAFGAEGDSWRRALARLSSEPGITDCA